MTNDGSASELSGLVRLLDKLTAERDSAEFLLSALNEAIKIAKLKIIDAPICNE